MAIPVHLLVAAAKVLSDPNTIKTVKSIYDAGTGLVDKAQGLRRAPRATASLPLAPPTKPNTGMRADMAKRWMLKPGAAGDLIRFTYTDDNGLVSVRTVGNWTSNGLQIRGYCLNLRGEHDFAIARIDAPEIIG
ncbi:MAG: hypothetical protein KYX66_12430 [Blastomonas fulva]|uniref:hypothetical protein n=1 Tax=Blastomonas fulva TaxID=1550728 RepID=UPI0024E1A906|nr:hypothetical protein [Blastomonas fulva]MDK2757532.1 hypothetical protein [Blastomonas fulva]